MLCGVSALVCGASSACDLISVACPDQGDLCIVDATGERIVKSFSAAEALCRSRGAALVAPLDAATNSFMHSLCPTAAFFDIGFSVNAVGCNAVVIASTGAAATFVNWGAGEPNNGNSANPCHTGATEEGCVGFFPVQEGKGDKWHDRSCTSNLGVAYLRPKCVICGKPRTLAPTPLPTPPPTPPPTPRPTPTSTPAPTTAPTSAATSTSTPAPASTSTLGQPAPTPSASPSETTSSGAETSAVATTTDVPPTLPPTLEPTLSLTTSLPSNSSAAPPSTGVSEQILTSSGPAFVESGAFIAIIVGVVVCVLCVLIAALVICRRRRDNDVSGVDGEPIQPPVLGQWPQYDSARSLRSGNTPDSVNTYAPLPNARDMFSASSASSTASIERPVSQYIAIPGNKQPPTYSGGDFT